MPEYHFSEASYVPPSKAYFVEVGLDFISDLAPTLPDAVKTKVAERAAAARFGEISSSACSVMEDPLLELNRHWEWPEVNAAAPYSNSLEYWFRSTVASHLWEPEQWSAKSDAQWLYKELDETSLSGWVHSVPMTQVRAWRDTLLPDRPKRGRKWELLMDLKQHPDFLAEAKAGYDLWREAYQAEIDRLLTIAAKKPRATHLEWLAQLVLTHLDNHHTATNSTEGPEAFAAACHRLQQAAHARPQPISEEMIDQEVAEAFRFVGDRQEISAATALAKGYLSKMRACLSADSFAAELKKYAPAKLVVTKQCRECEEHPRRGRAKRKIAPFHVFCTCEGYRWLPKGYGGSKHELHEWHFGAKVDRDATLWALDRLLGINEAPLNFLALLTRAAIQETEARVERDVAMAMAARTNAGTKAYRTTRAS